MKTHDCIATLVGCLLLFSCGTKAIENERAGKLRATHHLEIGDEKLISLDSTTATRPPYMQLYRTPAGASYLTLLNPYENAIQFYDSDSGALVRKIRYVKEGANAVLSAAGYYIKNMDSIYVYNRPSVEILLTDSAGRVNERIALRNDTEKDWAVRYPQYMFSTVCPMFEKDGHLLLPGLCPFSIASSDINAFRFMACIDMATNQVSYRHTYPQKVYGDDSNWEDALFMQACPTISPTGELVLSFPASHDLYLAPWNADTYTAVYGGSNVAGTIHAIDYAPPSKTPMELIYTHYLSQDLYAAVLYDPWRKVYYRFMQQGIDGATTAMQVNEKPIIVVVMDEQFRYLGETLIGTGKEWNWANSLVTEDGLYMEYIDTQDADELYLHFKRLIVKENV